MTPWQRRADALTQTHGRKTFPEEALYKAIQDVRKDFRHPTVIFSAG